MRRPVLALIVSLTLAVAACGGSDTSSDGVLSLETPNADLPAEPNAAATEAPDDETQLIAFSQCMRDNGIDIGDPTVDADGNASFGGLGRLGGGDGDGPPEGIQEAFEECGNLLEGLQLGFQERDFTDFEDTLLELAQCMRENGIDMDDPDFSDFGFGGGDGEGAGGGRGGGPFGNVDLNDPVFEAALEACSDIISGFGGPGRRFGSGE